MCIDVQFSCFFELPNAIHKSANHIVGQKFRIRPVKIGPSLYLRQILSNKRGHCKEKPCDVLSTLFSLLFLLPNYTALVFSNKNHYPIFHSPMITISS